MKRWLVHLLGLVMMISFLPVGLKQVARAQEEQGRSPDVDRLFGLTAYRGIEELPYLGKTPAEDGITLMSPKVDVPYSQIVFQSLRNLDNWNIYIADGYGGSQTPVATSGSNEIQPGVNKGGTKIVYSMKQGAAYYIFTINPDGSGRKQLTTDKNDNVYPAWSPDGTQIVYQSYRDGQAEIYVMNADGSNQTRLTWSPSYDGMPDWSPDGDKIIFASDRVGEGGIWVMNTDGSEVFQLGGHPYSSFPSWSPDCNWIAYSADTSGSGWMEIWIMASDGSSPGRAYDAPNYHDALVGSWSPDSRFVAFTEITYINYHGQWYWTEAYLKAWDKNNNIQRIMDDATEWFPDWETIDGLPPTSSMSPLASTSPASFTVSWSAYDNGPLEVSNYDVQVREGAGAWVNWLTRVTSTSAEYQGIGGQPYDFRVRARDNGGNLELWRAEPDATTTVEALPPFTSVKPLPEYLRNGNLVEWDGRDPGGSGVLSFDIQAKDMGGGTWTDWVLSSTELADYFVGIPWHRYAFRSRAVDKAHNLGNWSTTNGDTTTTLYSWKVAGVARDNTGVPAAQVTVATLPVSFVDTPSDREGIYAAYAAGEEDSYRVSWDKAGYGDLPPTDYLSSQDAQVEVILPPNDNIIANWGFESGNFDPGWSIGGSLTPTLASGMITHAYHSGDFGALLGQRIEPGISGPVLAVSNTHQYSTPAAVVDDWGIVHVAWADEGATELYYTQRKADGAWLKNREQIAYLDGETEIEILVDTTGNAHLVWTGATGFYYAKRSPQGDWLTPQNIADTSHQTERPLLTLTPNGTLHIGWVDANGDSRQSMYVNRDILGNWSEVTSICSLYCGGEYNALIADQNGVVHALDGLTYLRRAPDGTWMPPVRLPSFGYGYFHDINMAVDGNGIPHVIFYESVESKIYHTQRSSDSSWSTYDIVVDEEHLDDLHAISQNSHLYLLWCQGDFFRIVERDAEGVWGNVQDLPENICNITGPNPASLAVDDRHNLYIATSFNEIYYRYRDVSGIWSPPQTFPGFLGSHSFLKVFANEEIHLVWNPYYDKDIMYAGPASAEVSGDAVIYQVITVPVSQTNAVLSYVYNLNGRETTFGSGFTVQITDNTTTTIVMNAEASTTVWQHAWADLTPWAGRAITISFSAHQTKGYYPLWAYLDEVTVGSAHPDVWVSALGAPAAMPGDTVSLQLTYGNRSPVVDALSATITATLPTGLIFASASLTPTVDGSVLTWSVDDLPAGSGPLTIQVTATVAGEAAPGSNLIVPVEIAAAAPELELVNNQQEYVLFIGSRMYLPVIVR